MALQKGTKHIPFNKGFDDKVDDRLAPEGSIKSLENCVFKKNGRIDVTPTLREINDTINDGTVKSMHVIDENEMFVFSDRGTFLKQGDHAFEQISRRNFFNTSSEFISREEQVIHNPNIIVRGNRQLAAYQIRQIPNASVKYFLIDRDTGKLLVKGELFQARDPIPFMHPFPGILYKDLDGRLKFVYLNNPSHAEFLSVNNSPIRLTDDDTTDLVQLNDGAFVWVNRHYTNNENRIDVHRFNFGNIYPQASQRIVLSSVAGSRDLGRVFANVDSENDGRVRICTTLKIGTDETSVEVYDYILSTNVLELSFTQHVKNDLSDEIIKCVATRTQNIVYSTTQDDVRFGENALLYDGFALIDMFLVNNREYFLIANREVFVVLDDAYKFVFKVNDSHYNNFRDIRRCVVISDDGHVYFVAPRLATLEGAVVEGGVSRRLSGFALYMHELRLDRDQDREVERLGSYYMISGTPLSFFDRREVVEYGFAKSPNLRIDSSFEV